VTAVALFEMFQPSFDVDPGDDASILFEDVSTLQIASGTVLITFRGSGLTYDADGALTGGQFTGFEVSDSAHGGLQARASGFRVDVADFFQAVLSPDPDGVDKLLMSGSDTLVGSSGDDTLNGYDGMDLLVGNAGNDTLEGTVYDTLRGGAGDDTYILPNGAAVDESGGGGIDTVHAYYEYTLPDGVENLVLEGNVVKGAGNSANNLITGNVSDNILDGGAGIDTLVGGAGNDTYTIGDSADVIIDTQGDDTVNASVDYTIGAGIETLFTTATRASGNDSANFIAADRGVKDNLLQGFGGNDTIFSGEGTDTIDGGDGLDHAYFEFPLLYYTFTNVNGVITATSSPNAPAVNDKDILTNVERLDFGGVEHLAFDIEGHGGQAYRLYQAAFDRVPDLWGLGYQIHDLDVGVTLEQVAANFIASPEFQSTYGTLDNTAFITLLYRNVLDRAPDPGGLQYHLGEFAQGDTRAQMLIHFSESPENKGNVLGAIQDGMEFYWNGY
jgi:hypothetical protein